MTSKAFAGFDDADFRIRWIQSIVLKRTLLASSGAECRPGVHSDVRVSMSWSLSGIAILCDRFVWNCVFFMLFRL